MAFPLSERRRVCFDLGCPAGPAFTVGGVVSILVRLGEVGALT